MAQSESAGHLACNLAARADVKPLDNDAEITERQGETGALESGFF
jgi:hypothetical protein